MFILIYQTLLQEAIGSFIKKKKNCFDLHVKYVGRKFVAYSEINIINISFVRRRSLQKENFKDKVY